MYIQLTFHRLSLLKITFKDVFITLLLFPLVGCNSGGHGSSEASNDSAGIQLADDSLVLAVNGRGYLIFDNGVYRRSARLGLDASGYIVSSQGERLLGFPYDSQDRLVSGSPSDLAVAAIDPALVDIDDDGVVFSTQDGVQILYGQIALADFESPTQLSEIAPGVFEESIESGFPIVCYPGCSGTFGQLSVGSDDVAEVDYFLALTTDVNSYLVLGDGVNTLYSSSVLLFNDNQGFIVDDFGNRLMVYGEVSGGALVGEASIDFTGLQPLTPYASLNTLPPRKTDQLILTVNLDSQAVVTSNAFDHLNEASYNFSHELSVYDSQGHAHSLTLYFVLTATDNEWQMHYRFTPLDSMVENSQLGGPYSLEFDDAGELISDPSVLLTEPLIIPNGADSPMFISINISDVMQEPQVYSVSIQQDGYPSGGLSGLTVEDCGRVVASFTNGVQFVAGQLALAGFSNSAGLSQNSDGLLLESLASGSPDLGIPCVDGFMAIQGDSMD